MTDKLFIDDTPTDFADVITFENELEESKYWEKRKKQIEKEQND